MVRIAAERTRAIVVLNNIAVDAIEAKWYSAAYGALKDAVEHVRDSVNLSNGHAVSQPTCGRSIKESIECAFTSLAESIHPPFLRHEMMTVFSTDTDSSSLVKIASLTVRGSYCPIRIDCEEASSMKASELAGIVLYNCGLSRLFSASCIKDTSKGITLVLLGYLALQPAEEPSPPITNRYLLNAMVMLGTAADTLFAIGKLSDAIACYCLLEQMRRTTNELVLAKVIWDASDFAPAA